MSLEEAMSGASCCGVVVVVVVLFFGVFLYCNGVIGDGN